jgi:hypothetical protein
MEAVTRTARRPFSRTMFTGLSLRTRDAKLAIGIRTPPEFFT